MSNKEKCPHCGIEYERLAKHIEAAHLEVAAKQKALVIAYYQEGKTAREIVKLDDVMYKGYASITRIIKDSGILTTEELEKRRVESLKETLKEDYASGKYDDIKKINSDRNKTDEAKEKNSKGLKKAYADKTRLPVWKGETKESNSAIYEMSRKVSDTHLAKVENGPADYHFKSGPANPGWIPNRANLASAKRNQNVFSNGQKQKIKHIKKHKCEFCGIPQKDLDEDKLILDENRMTLEVDHIEPIFKGGTGDHQANAQLLCSRCHIIKSTLEKEYNPEKIQKVFNSHPILVLSKLYNMELLPNNIAKLGDFQVYVMPLDTKTCHNVDFVKSLKDKNITVIYMDEWLNKRDIVKSMIENKIGLTKSLHGRKCEIVELTYDESKDFFNTNHIAGHTKSIKTYGLKYDNEIVCAVSLRKPFIKKNKGYIEIARFATKLGYRVNGGFSKILKKIKEYAKEEKALGIFTYADLRLGTGNVYKAAGFTNTGNSEKGYDYTDQYKRFGRFIYKADKQNNKTEKEVAKENGVHRVYGVGPASFKLDV